jgi:outer membrane cobalamin receptor
MPRRPLVSFCPSVLAILLLIAAVPSLAHADTVRGRVLDPQHRPVANATVIVRRGQTVIATLRSGADGQFGPLAVSPGTYEITAGAPGLRAVPQSARVSAGRPADLTLTLAITAVGEAVVVSAAQVEIPLSQVPDAVSIVDRSTLETLQITTASDALRLVPGFHLVSSGGTGGLVSLFPRGGESDYTLVLVDGVPQNSFGGGFDGAHLSVSDLDRLEVVRGPQSALYGSGAIGGIVHAVTRLGGPLRAQAAFETGGYGTSAAHASATASRSAWAWRGAVDWLATDGDTRERASLGGRVANADYDRVEGSGSLSWSDRPSRRVRVDVRGGRNERGTPGAYGSDPMGFFGGLDLISRGRNRFGSVGASALLRQGPTAAHRLHLTWATFRGHFVAPFGESDDDTRRATGRYQLDLDTRVPLSAGWELQHERADNTFVTGESSQLIPIGRTLNGWFVEARPVIGANVFLNLGARVDRIARERLEGDAFGSRPTFDAADVVWSVNPKIAVAWMPRGWDSRAGALGGTKIRVGAGTGIKPPTTFDIAFTDNPSLKPERSRSVDAGVEQALVQDTLVVDATWFRNDYDDLIVSVPIALREQGLRRHRTDNISNARATGVELGVTWRPARALAVRGGWTWLDTEIQGIDQAPTDAPLPYVVGDPLTRRPARQGALAITWQSAAATAFLRVNGRGTVLDLEPNRGAGACFGQPASCRAVFDNPAYVTTEIGGSWRVSAMVEAFGRVSNLFDRTYEEVLGFPALGRSAMVGLRVAGRR